MDSPSHRRAWGCTASGWRCPKRTRGHTPSTSRSASCRRASRAMPCGQPPRQIRDLNVLDTLDDEFDPVRAMDAFGARHHVEPGMEGARSAQAHARDPQAAAAHESGAVAEPDAQGDATDKAGIGERMRSDSGASRRTRSNRRTRGRTIRRSATRRGVVAHVGPRPHEAPRAHRRRRPVRARTPKGHHERRRPRQL